MSTVLVITAPDDKSATAVIDELYKVKCDVLRCDLADFPIRARFGAMLDTSENWVSGIEHDDGWGVDLHDITAVYYRRSTDFSAYPDLPAEYRRFVEAELRMGLGGTIATLPARFINHPFRIADVEFKPGQLILAKQCGLTSPSDARRKRRRTRGEIRQIVWIGADLQAAVERFPSTTGWLGAADIRYTDVNTAC